MRAVPTGRPGRRRARGRTSPPTAATAAVATTTGEAGSDPRRGERREQQHAAGDEIALESPRRHLPDGQARVRGAVRQRDLAGEEEEVQRHGKKKRPVKGRYGARLHRECQQQRRAGAGEDGLHRHVRRQERALPEISRLRLGEKESRVDGGRQSERRAGDGERQQERRTARSRLRRQVQRQHGAVAGDQERAAHQPASPLRAGEDHVEAPRVGEIARSAGRR